MDREIIINLACFYDIDRHTALYLSQGESESSLFILIVMLLSHRLYFGDVCIDIQDLSGEPLSKFFHDEDDDYEKCKTLVFPDEERISSILKKHPSVGRESDFKPLIFDENGRLYFYKYRKFETSLASNIIERTSPAFSYEEVLSLRDEFMNFFPSNDQSIDVQALSAYLSLRGRLMIISGGPGTGKTSTVVKIISLLASAYNRRGHQISIALAAPTGKAAARLKESVNSSITKLKINEDIVSLIPNETYTIHRLLKTHGKKTEFIHNEKNKLHYDVVVVDESSMVDLALMSRLMGALKKESHLILLGDRDQLASVEGGAVFGDICDRGNEHGFTKEMSCEIANFFDLDNSIFIPHENSSTPILNSLAVLQKSYRFGPKSGIGLLAENIKKGNADQCIKLLCDSDFPDISIIENEIESNLSSIIEQMAHDFFENSHGEKKSPENILDFIGSFSVLTAMRKGVMGSENMNTIVEKTLAFKEIIDPSKKFYIGRPVMIRTNNYRLNLFNGDIGVIRNTGNGKDAVFYDDEGKWRNIPFMWLPEHETAFAMTVHKSQGSEFDNIMLVIPQNWNRILTRELLYTAVTRAKKKVIIVANREILKQMVLTSVNRSTGLRERIWQENF